MVAHDESPETDVKAEDPLEEPAAASPGWLTETPFWAVSAVLHLILIFTVMAIPVLRNEGPAEESIPLAMKAPPKEPPPYDPTPERDIKTTPKLLDPEKIEKPIIKREIDEVTTEMPEGTDRKAVSNVDFKGGSFDHRIGVSGSASKKLGDRLGKNSLVREGGSEGTESAVRAALEWLRRHQSPDGRWSSKDFTEMCKKTCRNKDPERYGDGRGFEEHDVGVTALAMLAFTGYGQTHTDGDHPEYVEVLRKAVGFMKKAQVKSDDPTTNGRYGPADHEQWIYDHSIATMAMAELLVMSNDVIGLKRSVTDAVRLCLRARNEGFGWRYGIKPAENDTSVTGWMVLALKTAKNARLGIPRSEFDRAFAGALRWFDRATASNGKCGYLVPGDAGSQLAEGYPEPYPYSKELSCMTAVSVLCRLFGGESRKVPSIRQGVQILMREPPTWQEQKGRSLSKINIYYWYYGTYALFQFGGKDWRIWNERMQEALIPTQRQGNIDEDGSWDPIGEWGLAGGRVYSTALGAMTLEVFYRFERHKEGVGY